MYFPSGLMPDRRAVLCGYTHMQGLLKRVYAVLSKHDWWTYYTRRNEDNERQRTQEVEEGETEFSCCRCCHSNRIGGCQGQQSRD